MKLAKQHHLSMGEKQRFKVISRRGAYHGVTSMALRALGTVLPMRQIMEPLMGAVGCTDEVDKGVKILHECIREEMKEMGVKK